MIHITHVQLPFFVMLLLLIIFARMLGEIFERWKQPSMIGEILAGCILGPSILNIIHATSDLKTISDLGVFLLVVLAGMQIKVDDVINSVKGKNAWIAIMGFIIPMGFGLGLGRLFHMDQLLVLFLGLCIAITALPVSIRILMDLGKLDTVIGQRILSAAIFNDVVSLLVLGVILDFKSNSQSYTQLAYSIGFASLKFLALITIITIAYRLVRKSGERMKNINVKFNKLLSFLKNRESLFALVMVFVLIFASISEILGLHFVVGAFFGAILLSKELLGDDKYNEVQKTTSQVTMGFLAPVFFALIGVQLNIMSINNGWLLFFILLASFISKILGGYIGARIAGFSNNESTALGIGLNARGIMELVIANIALANAFIDISMFSILVIMGITTTLASPVLLKWAFARVDRKTNGMAAH